MTVAVLGLLPACGAGTGTVARAAPASAGPSYGTSLDAPVSIGVLQAPLRDSSGHPTTLGALRGKIIVLSDVMTQCQEICPIGTASMLEAARRLAASPLGSKVEFVSLTIDPGRDDTRHLRAYRRTFGGVANWEVLGGSPAVVDRLWDTLGVWRHRTRDTRPYPSDWVTGRPLTYDVSHTDELIFIDAGQRFRFELEGTGSLSSGQEIPRRVYRFMDALGRRNLTASSVGDWSPSQVIDALHWLSGDPA